MEQTCDLCILGAGYAGVNALNAAVKYLPEGASVVVIARERSWGGQWVDQYDFVRLHQPYKGFTAGERQWKLEVPDQHLASKKEILQHFENIVAACVSEKNLNLVRLFEYEYTKHSVSADLGRVEISVAPLNNSDILPPIRITASKFIQADGADIKPKPPLEFSACSEVHSLCPVDVSKPRWDVQMRFSEDRHKPIYIVGSGKTAMDVINYLCKNLEGASQRIRCISGRGTWFMVREELGIAGKDLQSPDTITALDVMGQMIEAFDGTNARDVLRQMDARGFVHSAIPDPGSFLLGVCSRAEIGVARSALSPAEEKIIKAHLVDIISGSGGPILKLRALDGETLITHNIERKSFIVNCTDHVHPRYAHEPVLSDDGLVLSPQELCGFTGPSANMCTHLFYLGKLEPLWRNIPRMGYHIEDKCKAGLEGLMAVVMNNLVVTRALPKHVRDNYLVQDVPPPPHSVKRFQELMPRLVQNYQLLKGRYTDEPEFKKPVSVLGGNLLAARSKL